MLVLGALAVLMATLYLFFKAKAYRSKLPAEKQWQNAKAKTALGLLLFFFGINQLILLRSQVGVVVGVIFIGIGALYAWYGIRSYLYFAPLAEKEARNS